ncbi:arylesterase [Candidatus Raskinella chloraquaticus]|uniref:Arylesterase n=1 Tax=Candidatus Raskinella chloraquaticus TaxID=1951219 RepID=A0A1W9HYV1_9HYPH|nr:MAG: arylesterase [Proteobacteria bacterium SG_bin8]
MRRIAAYLALTISLAGILAAPVASAERTLRLVAVGDSLTAGYGLPAKDSFPAQLEALLRQRGLDVQLINAGVSGDTTSGGLARFDWSVPEGTDGVILELGANDALRGLDPVAAEKALDVMLSRLQERRIPVLLAGMYAPRNLGPEYVTAFDAIYPRLAEKYGTVFYPFFLEGMMGVPALDLGDGLHPNAEGVNVIARGILPKVEELITRIRQR